jgi:diaminopimelate decarboxylase
MSMHNVNLIGLHFHLGSPIDDVSPYQVAIDIVLHFAKEMNRKYSLLLNEFSPGGGFPVRYTQDSSVLSIADYAQAILSKLVSTVDEMGLPRPRCVIEPGRSIVAQAGVALYTVGAIKEIPGIRKYVAINGGMGDNIRPALYEAKYEAVVANKLDNEALDKVTIAGRYCESGDVLVRDAIIPSIADGDILAIPVSGAYCIPMSSNYNSVPRPGIIMVKDRKARLIRRRESYQDIMRLDVV